MAWSQGILRLAGAGAGSLSLLDGKNGSCSLLTAQKDERTPVSEGDLLANLGWNDALEASFEAHRAEGPCQGVSLEHNHVYRGITGEGEQLAQAAAESNTSDRPERAASSGDWVGLRLDARHEAGTIRAILPRRRGSPESSGSRTEEQVIAANVDVVLVVFGLTRP